MADAAVTFLLENVTQLLIREVGLVRGVGDEIKLLKVELALIHQFLRASKGKREPVKEVVGEIRSMAQEGEDVIDNFVVDLARHKRRNMFVRYIHILDHTLMLRGVATKIATIKNQIAAIYSSVDRYKIVVNDDSENEDIMRRESLNSRRRHVEEDEVVSFVRDAQLVMDMLTTSNMHLDIISVVGMGGLGKTTLAKKIYNDTSITTRFGCRAWANVSQDFRPKDVLLQLLRCITDSTQGIENLNAENLGEKLRNFLQDKKYLIVLDDVWKPEVWTGIKGAFPDTKNGSRILVTSRIKEVPLHASATPPYLLPLLNTQDSWELLSKKAFHGAACLPELESHGRKIAEKCKGLPLALVVIGGLLATKAQTTLVWSQMVANVSWYLEKNPESLSDVLALSYQELAPHLKPCFLYLGVYPEDYEMSARQLIRLWVAEGLIEKDTRRQPEDIADEYLQDLADRCLITVVKRRTDRGIKSCIIHDLLRDLCISEAAKDNFFLVHNGNGFIKSSSSNRPRRISLQCDTSNYTSDSSLVRSLLCFDNDKYKFDLLIFKDFLLVRVLDLGKFKPRSQGLSPKFEKLVLLRYLRIDRTDFIDIPSFICNLPNLQTLDLRRSFIKNLGNHFWKMQELRHFFVQGCCELSPAHSPSHIKTMRNLQTLSGVGSNLVYSINSETAFPNLRKLRVFKSELTCYSQVTSSTPNFDSIQTLKIVFGSHFVSHAGALISPRLTKLTLFNTRLSDSEFSSLSLPNLETLKLMQGSVVESRTKSTNKTFLRLQLLQMEMLNVDRWWVDEECLSNLKFLLINDCRAMTMAPKRLKGVTTLRHIKVSRSDRKLEDSFRALGMGENTRLEFEDNIYFTR